MRLKRITLNNFRCFEHLPLDLHPRLTVLVGENGAGKTALLDGIAAGLTPVLRYLSSANQRLSAEGVGIKDTDFKLIPREIRDGRTQWLAADYAQIIIEAEGGLTWDYWRPSIRGSVPDSKVGESALAAHVKTIADNLYSSASGFLPVFAYYGAQRGRIEIPERLRQSKEDYGHPTSALVGALDSLSNFKEMLKWFDIAEAAELRANKGRAGEDYELSPALQAVRCAITRLLGGEYENPYFNAEHRFVVEKANGQVPMQVAQLSQGYQSMLALGMDFARRLALANPHLCYDLDEDSPVTALLEDIIALGWPYSDDQQPPEAPLLVPAIMLVDEIDLHLHPTWQQRVLADLIRTFPLTQFIVTTHSAQVLTTVPSECIRILRNDKVYAAPAGTEGAEPQRLLRQVLGLKDVRPATNPAAMELNEYLSLVDRDQWNSPRALELRKKLDARYQGQEPALLEADLQIDNRKWELGT